MQLLHAYLAAGTHLLGASTPQPGNTPLPGNLSSQLDTVLGWVRWLGLAACVAGLFLVAGRMAISHRVGGGGEHMAHLGYVAAALVLIGGASSIVGFLA